MPWYMIVDRWGSHTGREFRSLNAALRFLRNEMSEPRCLHQTTQLQVWTDDQELELVVILRLVRTASRV
jgi:uncharacterized protein YegL